MKKVLSVIGLLLLTGSAFAAVNPKVKMPVSNYFDVTVSSVNVIYTTISVSSSAAILVPQLDRGVQRIITNNGTGDVYRHCYSSTTVITSGINLLRSGTIVIEDTYFGKFYIQSKDKTNEIVIEDMKTKF